jgi:glycosyltransferase involved in cell wall biosynthesis
MAVVSIGLPVYNGELYLKEAIESILNQTFTDFELIISDNASKDSTPFICESYARQDKRVRYYPSTKNYGASWNYNRTFKLAKGEYFKWAAHDDLCAPIFIERCIEVLQAHPEVILCYPKTRIIDEYGNFIKEYDDEMNLRISRPSERFKRFQRRTAGECNGVFGLIRKVILEKTSLIRNFSRADMVLLAQLSLLGEFYEISEELFFRRDHPKTSVRANRDLKSMAVWFDTEKENRIILRKLLWLYEFLKGIVRAKMICSERIKCFIQLFKWVGINRKELKAELLLVLRNLVFWNKIC